MKMSGMKKAIGLLASACMTFQLVGGTGSDVLNFSSQKTNAITNFSNASVTSQGSKKEDAVIRDRVNRYMQNECGNERYTHIYKQTRSVFFF